MKMAKRDIAGFHREGTMRHSVLAAHQNSPLCPLGLDRPQYVEMTGND
jgi:hypothetical protein